MSAKFEHLSENVIPKLIQEKAIFIEVGRRMSINSYYLYIIIMFCLNFIKTLNGFFFIEGNQSSCLRLLNITLLFITSWNSSNRFFFYLFIQNKIETDIYVFLFNNIRYFSYNAGYTPFFVVTLHMMMFTMMNTTAVFCGESSSNSSFSVSTLRKPLEHII